MNRGQSLFEVVVSLAISALIITALVSLVSSSIRNATFSRNKNQAASQAQAATEWLRSQRDSDINTFMTKVSLYSPAPTPYCFVSLSWANQRTCGDGDFASGTQFIRQGIFTVTASPGGKTIVEADVTVSWLDSQGLHEVTSATNFTDWRQR